MRAEADVSRRLRAACDLLASALVFSHRPTADDLNLAMDAICGTDDEPADPVAVRDWLRTLPAARFPTAVLRRLTPSTHRNN